MFTAEDLLEIDPQLEVKEINKTPNPQQVVWWAMHRCVDYEPIDWEDIPPKKEAGEAIVRNLLKGGKGHWSPVEAAKFCVDIQGFPHSVMQQLRTHRAGVSFSVCSGRFTGESFIQVAKSENPVKEVEKAYYLRPEGEYKARDGKSYHYTEEERDADLSLFAKSCRNYLDRVEVKGEAEEHARRVLHWDVARQPFVFSGNARSLLHILDLRSKKDAQLEIRALSQLLFEFFQEWMPEVAKYYEETRLGKAKLSP